MRIVVDPVERFTETFDNNAAHTRAGMGRDQFQYLVKLELGSELAFHSISLEQAGATLLRHLAEHFLTRLDHLPLTTL